MSDLDVDLAFLIEVMLAVNIIDMSFHSVLVVSSRPSIWQLAYLEILCSIVFLSALEVHLEERIVVASASVSLLQAFLA